MITNYQIVFRLIVAALLGGAVGLNREQHEKPAGLRTHMILCIASALAMALSINLAMEFRRFAPNGDPARLAAQVISGIGFLGAGAIIRFGTSVKGLTTAASLWAVANIGLAVGAGHHFAGVVTTTLLLITLVIMDQIEKRYFREVHTQSLIIRLKNREGLVEEVQQHLAGLKIEMKSMSVTTNFELGEAKLLAFIRIDPDVEMDKIISAMARIRDCKSVEIQ